MSDDLRFKDAAGREWYCRVDWAAMRRSVAVGVDLSQVEAHLGDFFRGSTKLLDALWAVIGPAATAVGVSQEQFESGIVGEGMERARVALLAGVRDFFPKSRAEVIDAAESELHGEIRSLLSQSRRQFTDLPEPLESTH